MLTSMISALCAVKLWRLEMELTCIAVYCFFYTVIIVRCVHAIVVTMVALC
jgi:hypothetical protein